MAPDARLVSIAAAQHGVFAYDQAVAAGLTRKAIRHRLATHRFHLIHRGVYALGHPTLTPLGYDMAAVLACGPGAALTSFTGAVLWDLLTRRDETRHVTRTAPHRRTPEGVSLRHVAELPASDLTHRHGIPVATPARTLLDLASDAAPRDLARAVEQALVRRLIDARELRARAAGRRGGAGLRALLDDGPRFTRSEAERRLLALIDRAGLPRPRTNVRVGRHEVDALWPAQRLVVEVDGYAFHGHRAAFERDRLRDADLQAAGLRVLRTTWRQLTATPEAVAIRLAVALNPRPPPADVAEVTSFLKRAGRYSDLIAAGAVVLVVAMMVIPLPPFLLDLFITLNISAALMIVIATLYVPRALDFSSFPALLLLTTLFRLAINVSVTRLILLEGDAGHVVEAFGTFVVGGNVVVGLVVFLILVVIQFVVITNGAGRVAEVGARFTLDAMPGKQMAIDADLNTGQITDEEARKRRSEVSREADFYGAMDGASKFVKGDAVAGILITLINLIGGLIIGVAQMGMPFGEAAQHFSLLTVGDGLCAQIPALLISVATGILVTRSASTGDLGSDVAGQILDQRKAPLVAGVVICCFSLVPGLPKLPFLLIGGMFFAVGWSLRKAPNRAEREEAAAADAARPAAELPAAPRDQALDALALDPLELAIGFGLVPLVDTGSGGSLLARVGLVRRQIAHELGMVIPSVRIHDDVGLDSHEYVMRVRGTEVARGGIMAGHQLAMDPGDAMGQLAGVPTVEPAFGLPAVWIADASRAEAEALGYTVVDAESVVVTHLTETIRAHAADLLTRQETRQLLDQLKEHNAAVVEEVVPDVLSVGEIQRVLQGLLREGVSIRDLGAILEAVGDKARLTRDPSMLAEYARQALGRTIIAPHVDAEGVLRTIALDPGIEQEVSDSIVQTADGEFLAMDPGRAQALVGACAAQVEHALHAGGRPVLLCSARVRRHLRRLCEQSVPQLAVFSYNEIAPGVQVETIGVVGGVQPAVGEPVLA